MATVQAPFFASSGEAQGTIELPEVLFGTSGSRRVLFETILALQANQRRGTSQTKTRGEVRGGGRKPWKQKGTGNARSGSIRSPLWRKGGIIFGPHPRSYRIDIDEVKKRAALQTALAEKAGASQISVIEAVEFKEPKTRQAREMLKKTGVKGRLLLVLDKKTHLVAQALRNIAGLELLDASELNAWHVLGAKQIFLTKAALGVLENRIPKG